MEMIATSKMRRARMPVSQAALRPENTAGNSGPGRHESNRRGTPLITTPRSEKIAIVHIPRTEACVAA